MYVVKTYVLFKKRDIKVRWMLTRSIDKVGGQIT